jgi:TrmH family RNA methyltransferase
VAEVIRSAANPLVKRVRLLTDRRHRLRQRAFVVHGAQPVWQAVEAGADVEALIVAPDLLAGPAAAMVAEQERRGVAVARLSAELFGRISPRDGPTGLAAIVRQRPAVLSELPAGRGAVYVALHEAASPGNLGTIIRTAAAAGAAGVVLVGPTADPTDPAAVRASMGALFSVPVARAGSADDFFAWCAGGGLIVAAATVRDGAELWDAGLEPPLALLLGGEGPGLPADVAARADLRIRIPMTGTAESLNLAVAAGILLYVTWRRRRGAA